MSDASEKHDERDARKAERDEAKEARKAERDEVKAARKADHHDDEGEPARESGEEQVDEAVEEANEQGFFGTEVDPTPNENYTASGVNQGLPTPETDDDAARELRARREQNRRR